MRKFESEVQHLKYNIYKYLTAAVLENRLEEALLTLPEAIVPGPDPLMRCCIYKEHAILRQRARLAVCREGDVIEILPIACDQCPVDRFTITETCRGCLANRCIQVCPKNAISKQGGKAKIDQSLCVECGKCREVCPYGAILDINRPCSRSCHVGAIDRDESKKAVINREKCIHCGACVLNCPFGAISDRSDIISVVKNLMATKEGGKPVYALVAPSVAAQFAIPVHNILGALRAVGFTDALETALGADMVAWQEAAEFLEKTQNGQPCLISACCPAFYEHLQKNYPDLLPLATHLVSPMIALGRFVKQLSPDAVTVFIGPCTAKKQEARLPELAGAVDYVLSFEELDSMLDAFQVDAAACGEQELENASGYGRLYAVSGGVAAAIGQAIREQQPDKAELFRPLACSGLEECDRALRLLRAGKQTANFIEGMVCPGGCVGGALSLVHNPRDVQSVKRYAQNAREQTIKQALRVTHLPGLSLLRGEQMEKRHGSYTGKIKP